MREQDHPDHIDKAKAKGLVDADVKQHGHVQDHLPAHADGPHDVPAPDHDHGQPDWAKAGKAHPDHWTQVGDTWVHDTHG